MKNKIFYLIAIVLMFINIILNNNIYAVQVVQPGIEVDEYKVNGEISADRDKLSQENKENLDFWGSASKWFFDSQNSGNSSELGINEITDIFSNMINVVGTTVIVIATIVLGIKYIIGTVESQTSAKEGLITLFVACIFFFGWANIRNLLFPNEKFIFTNPTDSSDLGYDTEYTSALGRVFSTFTYIANFVIVAVIIYVGIKYIFAGATGRAELKGKSVYFIIGIILVFATTNVLSFVSEIINDVAKTEINQSTDTNTNTNKNGNTNGSKTNSTKNSTTKSNNKNDSNSSKNNHGGSSGGF